MKTQTQRNLQQYVDYEVVDQYGNKIGKLQCLWSDAQGEPVYVGVQTGWLFGKTHVVPAERVEVNERLGTIRLPYTVEKIKEAPCYDSNSEIDAASERQIRAYYNLDAPGCPPTQSAASTAAQAAGGNRETRREGATIQLHEEQVKVSKRQVEGGGVRLRKIVRTETVNQPVELQREEIVIERVPAGQQATSGTTRFEQQDIFIPLRREEAVIEKESRVREEVRVSKKSQTERQTVSEQVRKEDVEIDRSGGTARHTGSMPPPAKARGTQPAGQKSGKGKRGKKSVFCLCRSEQQATGIVDELKRSGFSKNDISVLFPDKTGTKDFAHEKHTKAPEAATTGVATGGLLGGALGWLAGIGALAIPGVGPFIAAGPIVAALSGAAIGAGTGGLIGALVGLGIPEYEAKRYEGKIKEGNILISVHSDNSDETRRAKEIFERAGADDISTSGEEKVTVHAE